MQNFADKAHSPVGHDIPLYENTDLLEGLSKNYKTPLYCIDHSAIRGNCTQFKTLFPNMNFFYAVKANPSKEILQTVFLQGFGFDVASPKEFFLVLDLLKNLPEETRAAFIKNKIIYAHPVKSPDSLTRLAPYGLLATYDNIEEVSKIKKYAPNTRLLLRVAVKNPSASFNLSLKFGCDPTEAMTLIEAAISQGIEVEGICFHVGSQSITTDAFPLAMDVSLKIFNEAADKGITLKKLDIGGGFPVYYGIQRVCTVEDCAKVIHPYFEKFPKGTQFFAEPGRSIVGNASTAVCKVIGKKYKNGKQCIYIDDGVYGLMNFVLADIKKPLIPLKKKGDLKPTVIFGCTCDCVDRIEEDVLFPEMEIGDLIFTPKIGAYCISVTTDFNGMGDYSVYNHKFDVPSK